MRNVRLAADFETMRQTVSMNEIDLPIEDEGGDAACWAHLFEAAQTADLTAIAEATAVRGPAWRLTDSDLDANLLVFDAGQGMESHRNDMVDVLIVGIAGKGSVVIDGSPNPLWSGRTILIPKGSERQIVAETDRFACLSCHRAGSVSVLESDH